MTIEAKETPLLWGDKRYHTWNSHLRSIFGEKIFKVPLDAGFTCLIEMEKLRQEAVRFVVQEVQGILQEKDEMISLPNSMMCEAECTKNGLTPNTLPIFKPIRTPTLQPKSYVRCMRSC